MERHYLLVGNPTARSGKAKDLIHAVLISMQARGLEPELLATAPAGKTVELVREALDNGTYDAVVFVGGDGTFAEVAKGILAAHEIRPLGMIPSGTANDQAKSFGLQAGEDALEDNLDVVMGGHTIQLDVGTIERLDTSGSVTHREHFFDSVGWGMQADVLAKRNRDKRRVSQIPLLRELYRDRGVFVGAILERYLASFTEVTKFDADIVADGEIHHYTRLLDLVINATAVYAGSWVLDRWSEPDDGRFELVPFQGRRDWFSKLLRDFKGVPFWQEHLSPIGIEHSRGFSASDFMVELRRPVREVIHSQVDGEEWVPGNRFRITVAPNRLPLIIAADFTPPWKSDS